MTWRERLRVRIFAWLGVLVLPVRRHDVVVMRYDRGRVTEERLNRLRDIVEQAAGCRVLLMPSEVDIVAVLRREP